jgi:drug/metabolite transporter (DMT)-like permease
LTLGSALLGQLHVGRVTPAGWLWLACIAAVSTVAAIVLFFAGLRRAGPTSASILATVEPVVTVLLAFLVFGETLGALQLLGGVFVLTAVVVLSARRNLPDTAEWTQGRARSTRPRAAPASGRRPRYSPLSYLKEIPSRTR